MSQRRGNFVIVDPATSKAFGMDPVLDYDPITQVISSASADAVLELTRENEHEIEGILETHAHTRTTSPQQLVSRSTSPRNRARSLPYAS